MSLLDKDIIISNDFLDILINPVTKQKLLINHDSTQFENVDLNHLDARIEKNIPIIIPKNAFPEFDKSDVHKMTGSTFNYLDHYQKDAEFFDYFSELDSPITKEEILRLHQKIIERIPDSAKMILDVGCGDGWLSKKVVNKNTRVISTDVSFINVSRTIQNNSNENHFGLVADLFNLPLADESIDCIIASEVIEHVPDPKLFIEKLLTPLKKDGKLIISTPYNEKLVYHLCVHCNRPTPSHSHLHSFNEKIIGEFIPEYIKKWDSRVLNNKYLIKLRIYYAMKYLPFKIWEQIDKLANIIFKHPSRLIIEIIK